MTFKERIYEKGVKEGWQGKTLTDSIVMIREAQQEKITISWRGDSPKVFKVLTRINHPRLGVNTTTREDVTIGDTFRILENTRVHLHKPMQTHKGDDPRRAAYDKFKTKENNGRGTNFKRSVKVVPEPTGELAMFREIWNKRKWKDGSHRSEISGERLIEDVTHKLWVSQFMHVLPKSTYEHYRLNPDNIILGTWKEHFQQTTQPHKCQEDPKWDNFYMKVASLKHEYHREFPAGKKQYDQ